METENPLCYEIIMSTQIPRWPQLHKNKDILLSGKKQGTGLTAAAHILISEWYRED